jgi:hypothetical protein
MQNLFARTIPVLSACIMVILGYAVTALYADAAPRPFQLPPSTAISHYVVYPLINLTNTVIADLASQNSDGLNHEITTASTGRILVSAQVHIKNPGGVAERGACKLFISSGTRPVNGWTQMGFAATWYTTDNAAYDLTVPVLGYAIEPAGTYNVAVACEQLGASGFTKAELANMIVWEAAQ